MRFGTLLATFAAITLCAWMVFAQVDKGTEHLQLKGGAQGAVPFPHHRHQAALGDCLTCHSYFGQEEGAIDKAVGEGRLTGKQVMNKLCIQCHRTERTAGRKSGPLTCAACHKKG